MKTILRSIGFIAALAASSVTHAAQTYNYSYTFNNGWLVTGSVTGDAHGNLITNLSNISAIVNGTAFNGSGTLHSASVQNDRWVNGGAAVSFDGLQNNFLFIDQSDFFAVPSYFSNIFTSMYGSGIQAHYTMIFGPKFFTNNNSVSDYTQPSQWTLSAVTTAVPEPETYAMLLAGLGLISFAKRRKSGEK